MPAGKASKLQKRASGEGPRGAVTATEDRDHQIAGRRVAPSEMPGAEGARGSPHDHPREPKIPPPPSPVTPFVYSALSKNEG